MPKEPDPVGEINMAPFIPTLNGKHLTWLLERYISSCRARLDHRYTVDGYEYQLRWFVAWWEEVGPEHGWLLQPDDFMVFEKFLRRATTESTHRPLSYYTRATIIMRLKEALRWAQKSGYVERDYTAWIPSAEGAPPKRRAAQVASLHQLLLAAAATYRPVRDTAIIAMLMGMGLRRAELARINIEDVILKADTSGYAHVTGKRTKANPSGERDAAFDAATGKYILAHLETVGRKSGPMFTGMRGTRMTGHGIYIMVKKAIARAELEAEIIGPHDLRRAFATHYRRNRKDKSSADMIRRQLGHAHYSQTDEYTLLDIDDIRLDMVSPLSLMEV